MRSDLVQLMMFLTVSKRFYAGGWECVGVNFYEEELLEEWY